MAKRYDGKIIFINDNEQYEDKFRKRGINFARQYGTPKLRHPSVNEIRRLDVVAHTWKLGDRFYKLANEHYGDSEKWWVIAWYNQVPTESHVQLGDILYVPFPLSDVLDLLDV